MDGVSSSAVGKVVCVALFVDHFFQTTYVIIFSNFRFTPQETEDKR